MAPKDKQLKIKGVDALYKKELDKKLDKQIDSFRTDIDDILDKIESNSSIEGKKNTVMNLALTIGFIKAMNELNIKAQAIGVIVAKRWKTTGQATSDTKEYISTKIRYKTVLTDELTKLKSTNTTEKYIYTNSGNSIDWDDLDDLYEIEGGRKDVDG